MKEKLVVLTILILFLGSGLLLFKNSITSLSKQASNTQNFLNVGEITKQIETWLTMWENAITTTQQNEPTGVTPIRTPSPKKTSFPVSTKPPVPTTTSSLSQPLITCYRYKIPHLDGSSSNLCYEVSDYQTIQQLGYAYASAKTFYEFHLKGVEDYQKQYEKTGSSIYLDAKKSQQDKANEQKTIMDSTLVKMYTMEQQGLNR